MRERWEMPSPVGRLTLVADEDGLREISFPRGSHAAGSVPDGYRPNAEPFRDVMAQLEGYFAGKLNSFDLALAPEGTPFQREVWSYLRTIPYGETVSYGDIARRLGRPNAYRAVGAANGRNPIPIIIPCHRVIGADGSLTGFGGGLPIKIQLLELEARHRESLGGRSFSLDLDGAHP
jgi:methylated-DNA-[protein]-cysteine S-methyltransferase